MADYTIRLIAIHDTTGRIFTLLASPLDSPLGGVEVGADKIQTELEVPEMNIDLSDPQIQNRLAEVIENYQVECGTAKARLIKKAGATRSK
jgi:hypothetical protein